jgi:hypothetical protein
MSSNDSMTGYMCVFRNPGGPWMPIGPLRNEIHEGIGSQHDRLVQHLLASANAELATTAAGIRKWARLWTDIRAKGRTETYTGPHGREYGLLRMTITPADSAEAFTDPHATT